MSPNLLNSVPRVTYSSQYANLNSLTYHQEAHCEERKTHGIPTHPRVPFPNGTNAFSIRRASLESSQRLGSNFKGSGKYSGSWCRTQELIDTVHFGLLVVFQEQAWIELTPAGMKTPSNICPPSGTSRGSRPGTPKDRRSPSFITADFFMSVIYIAFGGEILAR
jgi:hypothetical protein